MKTIISKPNITGTLINLRPIVKADAQGMLELMREEEGMFLTGSKGTFTLERIEKWCTGLLEADGRVDYAITLKDDPAYIGEVVLNDINTDDRSANFRIALNNSKHFNKGYGSEATYMMLKHGFETLKLHRIELSVYDHNPRARRVYEKVGFVKEGIRRDYLFWKGKFYSDTTMSMLEEEWFSKYKT